MNPFPDHRDLYLLVAGVVVGVLLSGAVFGRLAPTWYQQFFQGVSAQQVEDAQKAHAQTQEEISKLLTTGVSIEAVEEHLDLIRQDESNPMFVLQQATEQRSAQMVGLIVAVLLSVLIIMIIETQVSPTLEKASGVDSVKGNSGMTTSGGTEIKPAVARLKNVRYALMAIGLALIIAHPALLPNVPWLFLILLVGVGLAVGLVPLKSKATPLDNAP